MERDRKKPGITVKGNKFQPILPWHFACKIDADYWLRQCGWKVTI
jgi:hypothetical protein